MRTLELPPQAPLTAPSNYRSVMPHPPDNSPHSLSPSEAISGDDRHQGIPPSASLHAPSSIAPLKSSSTNTTPNIVTLVPSPTATPTVVTLVPSSTATHTAIAGETREGVTGNESEGGICWAESPPTLTTEALKDARWLALSGVPKSPAAVTLTSTVAALVAAREATAGQRKNARREAGKVKQHAAVGAILGGLLRRWGRSAEPVFRSRKLETFTGGPVSVRQYLAACDAMVTLELIYQSRSIRYGTGIIWDEGGLEFFAGKAPRFWPAQELLNQATHHGVTPASVRADFRDAYPTKPPVVPQPIQLVTLKTPRKRNKAPLPVPENKGAQRLREGVESFNQWIAEHDIRWCLPPRLKRVLRDNLDEEARRSG
jgi:hypothetical protein